MRGQIYWQRVVPKARQSANMQGPQRAGYMHIQKSNSWWTGIYAIRQIQISQLQHRHPSQQTCGNIVHYHCEHSSCSRVVQLPLIHTPATHLNYAPVGQKEPQITSSSIVHSLMRYGMIFSLTSVLGKQFSTAPAS